MNINKRIIAASLLSPLAILLIPIAASIFVSQSSSVDPMDDAPTRAAGIILFVITPIVYPILVAVVFLSTWALQKLHLLSQRSIAVLVVITAIIGGIFFGLRSPFGSKDQLIGIAVFSLLFFFCLGLGATSWWVIAKSRNNKFTNAKETKP